MKIITWNCNLPPWSLSRKQRLPKIVSAIGLQNPDIICFQEVFFKKDANYIINKLKNEGFKDFFHYKNLLIASKLFLRKKQGFVFKKQGKFFHWAFFDVIYGKAFQEVELKYGGNNIFLINTHLLSANACDCLDCQEVRTSQVVEIGNAIADKMALAVGDFNFRPDTLPHKKMMSLGLSDTFDKNIKTVKKGKFDYFFLKGIKSVKTELVFLNRDFSDHIGLTILI